MFNPTDYIEEILGEPSNLMRNPANADYQCPFSNSACTKRSHLLDGPFPVCTINQSSKSEINPICICPKRLFQADIINDVIELCWPDADKPKNPQVAYEVSLKELGKIDCVIADITELGNVNQFVSVEFQTVDITGSYFPAYDAIINNRQLVEKPKYNFNWRNVYKRYIMQLIFKGFSHHQWKTKLVAVMQDVLVDRLWEIGKFQKIPVEQSNIVFLPYSYQRDNEGRMVLKRKEPIGTRHMDLINGILYADLPKRQEFEDKILFRMNK